MGESVEAVELAVVEEKNVATLMRRATDVAGVCRQIVMNTAMELQGRRYVRVEGWESIAAAYGCVPSIREVSEDEKGNVLAVAELRRHDGSTLASAEGYCGMDEPKWAKGPRYARRGMAQTRAISRVCRSVFAFVVTLIDKNLSTTPAEEIPDDMGARIQVAPPQPNTPRGMAGLKAKLVEGSPVTATVNGAAAKLTVSPDEPPPPGDEDVPPEVAQAVATVQARLGPPPSPPRRMAIQDVVDVGPLRTKENAVRFGKSKGKHLCDLEAKDLEYHLAAASKACEDRNSQWTEKNDAWLDAVRFEVQRREALEQ